MQGNILYKRQFYFEKVKKKIEIRQAYDKLSVELILTKKIISNLDNKTLLIYS